MHEGGLVQGEDGLEVYVMAEIPANVLQAEEFAEVFDGFSIGSNDLTQLTLGVDRDSESVARLFNEQDPAVEAGVLDGDRSRPRRAGRKIGICGQAPSDYPEFAAFLVEEGIDIDQRHPRRAGPNHSAGGRSRSRGERQLTVPAPPPQLAAIEPSSGSCGREFGVGRSTER